MQKNLLFMNAVRYVILLNTGVFSFNRALQCFNYAYQATNSRAGNSYHHFFSDELLFIKKNTEKKSGSTHCVPQHMEC